MAPRVLLLGGHGKVSQLLTPLILSRSWHLTSVIRDPAQQSTITDLGRCQPGNLEVLVTSLEDIQSQSQAQQIIDTTSPSYIVWSAGAGGNGGPGRTKAIDQDACIAFIRAAAATPSVKKLIVVSYVGSRRARAPWWSEDEWSATQEINNGVLKHYYPAKLAADECVSLLYHKGNTEQIGISLRPGNLTDAESGKVALGKTGARGKVSRQDVARVTAELLANDGACSSWLDLLEGGEEVESAVTRCVNEGIDCLEARTPNM